MVSYDSRRTSELECDGGTRGTVDIDTVTHRSHRVD